MYGHRRSTSYTTHASGLLKTRHQHSPVSPLLTQCVPHKKISIENQVHSTFSWCEIDKIHQVNHPAMYGMYLLRKEEMQLQSNRNYVQEIQLYHVTTESNGIKSLENGLDWRRTRRSKYGRGVSFSDDCDYANFYANFSSAEDTRVIIVCTILVAEKLATRKSFNDLEIPPGTADTTVSPNGRVYVKYYDYEFYPLYVVYYRCKQENLRLSRYFNGKNGPRTVAVKAKSNSVDREREQQLLKERMQWQSEQREEKRLQQERKRIEDQRYWQRQQQQQQQRQRNLQQQHNNRNTSRHSNNNGCLIL